MAADVPLKSKRVPISFAALSTALRTSTMLGSQTVSNEGMAISQGARRVKPGCHNSPMIVEPNVSLAAHNSFGIVAKARALVRVRSEADVQALLADPELRDQPKFVLGGGSNIVITGDVKPLVLKVEVMGRRVVSDGPKATVVEAGAGENWHEFVAWTLEQGLAGL